MICPRCNKSGIYICSDKRNSWCRNCNSYFAHFDGELFFLGTDSSLQYAVREDGTIKKVRRKEEGNTVIIEEERLIELENKFKEIVAKKKIETQNYWDASSWWSDLNKEKKIEIYLLYSKPKQGEISNK